MSIGRSICRVSKETLIAVRDVIDDMTKNYVEYEYGDWKKDYKYKKDEWEEILRGNDYY